jgi:hypothetical protein
VRRQRKKLAQVARIQARGLLHLPRNNEAQDDASDAAEFDEALAAFGLQPAEQGDAPQGEGDLQPCYLWPCNVRTFKVWQGVQTQWRTSSGMDGLHRTGLCYTAVYTYMREVLRIRPTKRYWHEVWAGLQAMEIAAINEWAAARSKSA